MTSPLRPSVVAVFRSFSAGHEGVADRMYCDTKRLVTFGIGQLLRKPTDALAQPWQLGNRPATRDEILSDWQRVHDHPDAPRLGQYLPEWTGTVRLARAELERLFVQRRDEFAVDLADRWPTFARATAPEQLALMSWAWAAGTRAYAPKMSAALERRDLVTAAVEIRLDETKTRGIVERNKANRRLMLLAAATEADGGDPDALDLTTPSLEQLEARFGLRPRSEAPPADEGPVPGAAEAAALAYLTPIERELPDSER
jgi:GH24 family phage-related lysozyme (muramidase)